MTCADCTIRRTNPLAILYITCAGNHPGRRSLTSSWATIAALPPKVFILGKLLQSFVSGTYARYAHFGVKGSFRIVNPFVMYAIFINHVTIVSVYNYISTFHYTCVLLITYNREHISQQWLRICGVSSLGSAYAIRIRFGRFSLPDFGFMRQVHCV